jgi:tetratricopeptide (TPR) repeat protein
MPTHIFVRLGEWDQVIDGNERAAAAALLQKVGASGEYVWDEFPHAIEYMVYAQLQRADDAAAAALIETLGETPDLQPSFKTAFHFASTAARYAVERQDWTGASALPARTPTGLNWDAFPWPEAIVWYARGLGAAHLAGHESGVTESLARLTRLSAQATEMGEPVFAAQIEILRLELTAWQAFAAGDRGGAVRTLGDAARLERQSPKHPVTPGATLPALELLGDLYLAMDEPALARDAYDESNRYAPGRFNTILGLARAAVALGDADSARSHYGALMSGSAASSNRAGVREARAYLAGG